MHRFGLDGMLQGCGGNLKHLQNRSPSSLHWEATQIDQESTGGPALLQSLTMLRLASTRSDKYVPVAIAILQIWLQEPGLGGDPLFKSLTWPIGSVLLQANWKQSSLFSDSELWNLSDLPTSDAAILQVGMQTASTQRPFRFQTQLFNYADPLLGSQHHAEAHAVHCNGCKWETQSSVTCGT